MIELDDSAGDSKGQFRSEAEASTRIPEGRRVRDGGAHASARGPRTGGYLLTKSSTFRRHR
eukprot:COSAG06_NODE_46480_length_346_cov_1.246964_1_plen_60_part_10